MRRKEILKWLIEKELTQVKIAREAGVHRSLVSKTIKGDRKSKAVFAALRHFGCPEEYIEEKDEAI